MSDFDNLNPDDFRTPIETDAIPTPRNSGETFEEFVAAHIEVTRKIYALAGGVLETIIHLATGDTDWSLVPEPPETLSQFLARARNEAQKLEAKMMFVARPGKVGVSTINAATEALVDPADALSMDRAVAAGTHGPGVFYFAEQYDLVREFRHGVMLAEDGVLSQPIEGAANMTTSAFAQVLR